MPRFPHWLGPVLCAAAIATVIPACTVILDRSEKQCSVDADCTGFGVHAFCHSGVCSNQGPAGCFLGKPTSHDDFANQCSAVQCEPFDNCARLGMCSSALAERRTQSPWRGQSALIEARAPVANLANPLCVDPARKTVLIAGATSVEPFLSTIAKLVTDHAIAYLPLGSCGGVDVLFDPAKRNITGRTGRLFDQSGNSVACDVGTDPVRADIAVSDVFSTTCNAQYNVIRPMEDYRGPIQAMMFVVPADSQETAISAEMARAVFGGAGVMPYLDESLYFIRNASSGTQQMLGHAIGVAAAGWNGVDRGGATAVATQLKLVPASSANGAIGILSADIADRERSNLRILAFKDVDQTCAYYPDSTLFLKDKVNVRDGHYPIWGPLHFYTELNGATPTPAASAVLEAVVTRAIDASLIDALIDGGLIPSCAMKVQRTIEMGPLSAFEPTGQCGCYFETRANNGVAPASCKTCSGAADCSGATPACNLGFCEAR